MNLDDFKQAWRTQSPQTRLTIDADLLFQEVRRNQRHFTATIFWRDVREVGTALLMGPLWIYLGVKDSLPWTWYLTLPVLVWIAGFALVDRMRHKRQPSEWDQSLRQFVNNSLAQVEHQIWLLQNIFWWYILPPALSSLAFFCQVAWLARAGGWRTVLVMQVGAVVSGVLVVVYWLNQRAVRTELEPRRQELEALLMSLQDETPDTPTGV